MPSHHLAILDEKRISQVIQHGFHLLHQMGCRIELAAARTALADKGCPLLPGDRVSFPADYLWQAVAETGTCQQPQQAPVILMGCCRPRLLDFAHRTSREGSSEDVMRTIQLTNQLDGITLNAAGIVPFDVPREAFDVANAALLCKYSVKPFWQDVQSAQNALCILQMLAVAGGKNPMPMLYLLAARSPLCYDAERLSVAKVWIQAQQPVVISSSPVIGRQSPSAVGTALVQIVSEWLAGLAYLHALAHRAPVILHGAPLLKQEEEVMAAPELATLALAMQQIADRLGYPCWSGSGYSNISWWDLQVGWEKGIDMLLPWLAGSVISGYAGLVGNDFSAEQLVLDHHAALHLRQFAEASRVSDPLPWQELSDMALHRLPANWPLPRHDPAETIELKNIEQAHTLVEAVWQSKQPDRRLSEQQCQAIDGVLEKRLRELGE